MNNSDITKIYMYRERVEEIILSLLFSRKSNIWNLFDKQEYKLPMISFDDSFLRRNISKILHDTNRCSLFYEQHKEHMDYVIKYEDLTGNPNQDMADIFNLDLDIKYNTTAKLSSMEDKIKHINYENFKQIFDFYISDLEMINRIRKYFRNEYLR